MGKGLDSKVDHLLKFNQLWNRDPGLGDIKNIQMELETMEKGERA